MKILKSLFPVLYFFFSAVVCFLLSYDQKSLFLPFFGFCIPLFFIGGIFTYLAHRYLIQKVTKALAFDLLLFLLTIPFLEKGYLFLSETVLYRIKVLPVLSIFLVLITISILLFYALLFIALHEKNGEPAWLFRIQVFCSKHPSWLWILNSIVMSFFLFQFFSQFRIELLSLMSLWPLPVIALTATFSFYTADLFSKHLFSLKKLHILLLALSIVLFGFAILRSYSQAEQIKVSQNIFMDTLFHKYQRVIRKKKVLTSKQKRSKKLTQKRSKKGAADFFSWEYQCEKKPEKKYNIVWFVIDALRAKRLFPWKYKRKLWPRMTAFIEKKAVSFKYAFSPSSTTLYALPSMLTGTYPSQLSWKRSGSYHQIKKEVFTLTELLKAQGYNTGTVLNNWINRNMKNTAQGFDSLRRYPTLKPNEDFSGASGARSRTLGLDFLKKNDNKPFFLFNYYAEPHSPYTCHKPPEASFGSSKKSCYDSEIAYLDSRLAMMLEYLSYQSYWENTIVIITSDHGEEFREHGMKLHSKQLYRESIHVPLMIRIPGQKAKIITENVSLVDIVPTLLELNCFPPNEKMKIQGHSLLPLLKGEKRGSPFVFGGLRFTRRVHNGTHTYYAVYGDHHLIHNKRKSHYQFYPFKKDPQEREDLFKKNLPVQQKMLKALQNYERSAKWWGK